MKLSHSQIRSFSFLLSLLLVTQGCGPRSEGDDSRKVVFTKQELTADLDHLSTPLDTSNLSKTEEDYEALRKRESTVAIEGKDEDEEDELIEAKSSLENEPSPSPSKTPKTSPTSKPKTDPKKKVETKKSSSKKSKKTVKTKAEREAELPSRFSYTEAGGLKSAWKKCNLFMDEEGKYGSYGRIVTTYIDEDLSEVLLSNRLLGMDDAPYACPNWKSFDNDMKKKFWVWIMAAIAADESGCNAYVKDHKDVTGNYTFGLYQLERSDKLRLSNRRFDKHCTHSLKDLRKPLGSIRCALDMMTTQLITRKTTPMEFDGHLYPAPGMEISTYFNDFHHAYGDNIGRLIRSFTPCGANEPHR